MTKYTLNGTRKKVLKTSGFRARISSKTGRKVLKRRKDKGRKRIALLK